MTPKPSDALPSRYDVDLRDAPMSGQKQRAYAAGVTMAWPERYRQVIVFHEMEMNIWKIEPTNRPLRSHLEEMFQEELVPQKMIGAKYWDDVYGLPEFAHDYEGDDIVLECFVVMLLMMRNYLGQVRDLFGTKRKRYQEECKLVNMVITPNKSVFL